VLREGNLVPMTKLEAWLKEHGLDKCFPILAANAIDFDSLPGLRDSDLVKLGLSLAQRRKLMRAIAARVAPPHPSPVLGRSDATPFSLAAT
jgi:hypothetical protein